MRKYLRRAGPVAVMCACVVFLWASQSWAVIVIDNFSDGDQVSSKLVVDMTTTTDSSSQIGLSGVLGGDRDMELVYDHDGSGLEAEAFVQTSGEVLQYSNDSDMQSHLTITYDGMTDFDLTEGGASFAIVLDLEQVDLDQARIDITVDDGTNSDTVRRETSLGGGGGAEVFFYPFSDFTGVDFTSVEKIVVLMTDKDDTDLDDDADSLDWKLGEIRTVVPEPLTMLGMFLGLGSVGAYIRRRRMA